MNIQNETIIGEVVVADYRTAEVFGKYKIDFCCNGNRSIEDACNQSNISTTAVVEELQQAINNTSSKDIKYDEWPEDFLADYVVQKHHHYVENSIPWIKQNLSKLCSVHCKNHSELFKISEVFNAISDDLVVHMKKEELMLFPFIKKLKQAQTQGTGLPKAMFNSVENPISAMHDDHTLVGNLTFEIKELTNDYSVPADGCTTYRVTYAKLKEFQEDLFLHIHLENNILFPKAINIEKHLQN